MKLLTKKGKLTSYALHCGYVANKQYSSLMVEHFQYVVKSYGLDNKYFDTIKEARKYFNTLTN